MIVRRDVSFWIGGNGAGLPMGSREAAISDTLALIAKQVESQVTMEIDGNWW